MHCQQGGENCTNHTLMHFQGGALRACIAFERGSFILGGVHAFRGSFDMILVTCAGCVELLPLLEEPAFEFELCVRWSLVRILFIT